MSGLDNSMTKARDLMQKGRLREAIMALKALDSLPENYNFLDGNNDEKMRLSSMYEFKSNLYDRLSNSQKAIQNLKIACALLDSISPSPLSKIIECRNYLFEMLTFAGETSEARAIRESLFNLPAIDQFTNFQNPTLLESSSNTDDTILSVTINSISAYLTEFEKGTHTTTELLHFITEKEADNSSAMDKKYINYLIKYIKSTEKNLDELTTEIKRLNNLFYSSVSYKNLQAIVLKLKSLHQVETGVLNYQLKHNTYHSKKASRSSSESRSSYKESNAPFFSEVDLHSLLLLNTPQRFYMKYILFSLIAAIAIYFLVNWMMDKFVYTSSKSTQSGRALPKNQSSESLKSKAVSTNKKGQNNKKGKKTPPTTTSAAPSKKKSKISTPATPKEKTLSSPAPTGVVSSPEKKKQEPKNKPAKEDKKPAESKPVVPLPPEPKKSQPPAPSKEDRAPVSANDYSYLYADAEAFKPHGEQEYTQPTVPPPKTDSAPPVTESPKPVKSANKKVNDKKSATTSPPKKEMSTKSSAPKADSRKTRPAPGNIQEQEKPTVLREISLPKDKDQESHINIVSPTSLVLPSSSSPITPSEAPSTGRISILKEETYAEQNHEQPKESHNTGATLITVNASIQKLDNFDGLYVILKENLLPEKNTNCETVIFGHRTLYAWKMNQVKEEELKWSVNLYHSTANFKYRYALRLRKVKSFKWILTHWIIKTIDPTQSTIQFPIEMPVFPHLVLYANSNIADSTGSVLKSSMSMDAPVSPIPENNAQNPSYNMVPPQAFYPSAEAFSGSFVSMPPNFFVPNALPGSPPFLPLSSPPSAMSSPVTSPKQQKKDMTENQEPTIVEESYQKAVPMVPNGAGMIPYGVMMSPVQQDVSAIPLTSPLVQSPPPGEMHRVLSNMSVHNLPPPQIPLNNYGPSQEDPTQRLSSEMGEAGAALPQPYTIPMMPCNIVAKDPASNQPVFINYNGVPFYPSTPFMPDPNFFGNMTQPEAMIAHLTQQFRFYFSPTAIPMNPIIVDLVNKSQGNFSLKLIMSLDFVHCVTQDTSIILEALKSSQLFTVTMNEESIEASVVHLNSYPQ